MTTALRYGKLVGLYDAIEKSIKENTAPKIEDFESIKFALSCIDTYDELVALNIYVVFHESGRDAAIERYNYYRPALETFGEGRASRILNNLILDLFTEKNNDNNMR